MPPFSRNLQSICAWRWSLELAMVKCKSANQKATCDFLCVGNSCVCRICHHLELITCELLNVLDLNLWTLKWRLRMSTVWMKIYSRSYLVNVHMFAKNGSSRSSRLIAVLNHTFHEGQINDWTYDLLAFLHHRNSVKRFKRIILLNTIL